MVLFFLFFLLEQKFLYFIGLQDIDTLFRLHCRISLYSNINMLKMSAPFIFDPTVMHKPL